LFSGLLFCFLCPKRYEGTEKKGALVEEVFSLKEKNRKEKKQSEGKTKETAQIKKDHTRR